MNNPSVLTPQHAVFKIREQMERLRQRNPNSLWAQEALRMGADALEATIPKVLTLAEAEEQIHNHKPVVIEDVRLGAWWQIGLSVAEMMVRIAYNIDAPDTLYGTKWRCWSAYPTPEQRAAVPWQLTQEVSSNE